MKTSTHKLVLMLCLALTSIGVRAQIAHGSAMGTGLSLYSQYNAGTLNPTTDKGVSFDYKIVTIGSKSWAWTNVSRTGGVTVGGATWASQLRYWNMPANSKTENNLLFRVSGTQQTYGFTTNTIPANLQLTFYQNLNPGGDCESERITYDKTAKNSADPEDITAPVLMSATTASIEEVTATLTLDGSDDSGHLFYHIVGNGILEVSFKNSITLSGLTANTSYSLTVTPIDFSGNEGTPQVVNFTTAGLIQVTYGVAKDIRFKFKSTGTQLEYYYEFINSNHKFRDAFLKITPAGDTEFEIKPTISPDSTYAYGLTTDSRIANKVLTLNCGYFIYVPGEPVWEDYVTSNTLITSGDLSGTPIKHQMNGPIHPTQAEAVNPVLNGATLVDITSTYAKININGNDNSGYLYYELTGAKNSVNAFRTGDYYLTAIEPGKNYTVNVIAKDFSGNYTPAQQVQIKTMNARSNVTTDFGCAYNSTVPTSNPELVTIIQQSGNTLTLGCTTASTKIAAGPWRDRVFHTPTVRINGTSYPLVLDENATTATVTFNNTVGSVSIEEGASFLVQWSVFWGVPGEGGGNFFTGTFSYVIGDNGQVDTDAPSVAQLTLAGNELTWPACNDILSGVKWYLVQENGQPVTKIFDLGQTSFSYTMANANSLVTVTAVDFVGNSSSASKNDLGTSSAGNTTLSEITTFPNPATDRIYFSVEVSEAGIYTLNGQRVSIVKNVRSIDISGIARGLYILRITDTLGNQKSTKIEFR